MKYYILILILLPLSGCSSTPDDLKSSTTPTVQSYRENYQEIYRRISTTGKRCVAGNISAQASMTVDADLYSELGYGEVTASLINWGARNYYWSAKIERDGTGSKVIANSGNALAAERAKESIFRWAAGEQTC